MNISPVILVTGACGQIGTELVKALRQLHGKAGVIASDILDPTEELLNQGTYVKFDVMDRNELDRLVNDNGITQIYHLAAMLSAKGEQQPLRAWDLNMQSLLYVLETARNQKLDKVFWPSSIAVFGKNRPQGACAQHTVTEPATVYGLSKLAGEQWCSYYFERYGVDVRSLRYPGLISYSAQAGGGTTDYAVDIFPAALNNGHYTCFLQPDTRLPMLYMPDAINATINLMEAPKAEISIRTAYNLGGLSFTPAELALAIRHELTDFSVNYEPDFRQKIAESWPALIDDTKAQSDWGWKPDYTLPMMVKDMLSNLRLQNTSPINC
jgi:nucleoside-diphosphate-sugar epimerase